MVLSRQTISLGTWVAVPSENWCLWQTRQLATARAARPPYCSTLDQQPWGRDDEGRAVTGKDGKLGKMDICQVLCLIFLILLVFCWCFVFNQLCTYVINCICFSWRCWGCLVPTTANILSRHWEWLGPCTASRLLQRLKLDSCLCLWQQFLLLILQI